MTHLLGPEPQLQKLTSATVRAFLHLSRGCCPPPLFLKWRRGKPVRTGLMVAVIRGFRPAPPPPPPQNQWRRTAASRKVEEALMVVASMATSELIPHHSKGHLPSSSSTFFKVMEQVDRLAAWLLFKWQKLAALPASAILGRNLKE